jgi:hypothetical protein
MEVVIVFSPLDVGANILKALLFLLLLLLKKSHVTLRSEFYSWMFGLGRE